MKSYSLLEYNLVIEDDKLNINENMTVSQMNQFLRRHKKANWLPELC